MESSAEILRIAIELIRKSQENRKNGGADNGSSDEYVLLSNDGNTMTAPPATTSDAAGIDIDSSLAIEYSDFALRYPYLFRMCTTVSSQESADNLIKILPMMLRQRDRVITTDNGGDATMKSATEAVMHQLGETYIAPLGIKPKRK